MKNADIHAGFEDGNIRDFLAKQVGRGFDGDVEILKDRISQLQEQLKEAERSKAARDLIDLNGWKDFDVSDEIHDYVSGEYFPFVGTEEELEQLEF